MIDIEIIGGIKKDRETNRSNCLVVHWHVNVSP